MNFFADVAGPANRVVYLQPAPPNLGVKERVERELAEFLAVIESSPPDSPATESLRIWHDNLNLVLNDPEYRFEENSELLINEFTEMLIDQLRDRLNPETPFQRVLFTNQVLPVYQIIVRKLRDHSSIFYDQAFDLEAPLADDDEIPPAFMAAIADFEAERAQRIEEDQENRGRIEALRGRIAERRENLGQDLANLHEYILVNGQDIREQAANLVNLTQEQRERVLQVREELRIEIDQLRVETADLTRQLQDTRVRLDATKAAMLKTQIAINDTREELKKKQHTVLSIIATVVVSVVATAATGKPIIVPIIIVD